MNLTTKIRNAAEWERELEQSARRIKHFDAANAHSHTADVLDGLISKSLRSVRIPRERQAKASTVAARSS